MTEALKMSTQCPLNCKLVDKVSTNPRPAYSIMRNLNNINNKLEIFIDDPFAIISGYHEIERHNLNDIEPERIERVKKLDNSINYVEINISNIDPSSLPKNYIIAYGRKGIDVEESWNEYNRFLQTIPINKRVFPYNIQFRRANRLQLSEIRKELHERNKQFLNSEDRIYINQDQLDSGLEEKINMLNPFCINFKVKI